MTSEHNHLQTQIRFNCKKCRFSTKDQNRYRTHESLHNDIKFACSHCTYVSYTKGEFQRHLVTHTGKFPYTCEYCGYGAVRNDYIIKHIKRIHGDGRIQCSLSGDLKNASVNLIQSQISNNADGVLQNMVSSVSEVIDLTNDPDHCTFQTTVDSNGNKMNCNSRDLLEVEVMSPAQHQLHPGLPLMVVAPSVFRVPPNCFAQVVEVRPVNSTFHLILKFLEKPDVEVKKEKTFDEKGFENNINPVFLYQHPVVATSSTLGSTVPPDCNNLAEASQNSLSTIEEASNNNLMYSFESQGANDTRSNNILECLTQEHIESVSPVSEGPFISSVFSLSSGSKNLLEGIHWENCSTGSIRQSPIQDSVDSLLPLNTPKAQTVHLITAQVNSVLENDKQSPHHNSNAQHDDKKQNVEMATSLSNGESLPIHEKSERQNSLPYKHQQTNPNAQIHTKESILGAKPQTLFLSCDRSVIMQPVSCAVQNVPKMSSEQLTSFNTFVTATKYSDTKLVTEANINKNLRNDKMQMSLNNDTYEKQPLKMAKKQSRIERNYSKLRVKTSFKTLRSSSNDTLLKHSRVLRLLPVMADQLLKIPDFNQPVVVLNHPDVDTQETLSIMKTINKFEGKIIQVILSKQMCKPKSCVV
ncbi:hypothetical protein GDO86_000220 [Hymenochirus boettgeri]|uniref:C2H2-type domain-containing protein n=1 Tax=Hymenochirus boettgeri TaxID=247094 RepID=A0A8T2KA59_9PIPI|nr:hypothetical protein GDO86_000220 [Hymenochirus boettgeri]